MSAKKAVICILFSFCLFINSIYASDNPESVKSKRDWISLMVIEDRIPESSCMPDIRLFDNIRSLRDQFYSEHGIRLEILYTVAERDEDIEPAIISSLLRSQVIITEGSRTGKYLSRYSMEYPDNIFLHIGNCEPAHNLMCFEADYEAIAELMAEISCIVSSADSIFVSGPGKKSGEECIFHKILSDKIMQYQKSAVFSRLIHEGGVREKPAKMDIDTCLAFNQDNGYNLQDEDMLLICCNLFDPDACSQNTMILQLGYFSIIGEYLLKIASDEPFSSSSISYQGVLEKSAVFISHKAYKNLGDERRQIMESKYGFSIISAGDEQ